MKRADLFKGHSQMLLLAALADGPKHGYHINQWVEEESNHQLSLAPGILYPLLHQLEQDKLITAEWEAPAAGPRKKIYSITKSGTKQLATTKQNWLALVQQIQQVIR